MELSKWIYIPQNGEQILFMHVPKTAGTTMRDLLTRHCRQKDIYPSKIHLFTNGNKYLKQPILIANRKDLLEKPVIMGHYNVRLLPHLSSGVKTIIFLREPMARIQSHIKHIISKEPEFKHGNPNAVIEERFEVLCNLQARILGYTKRRPNLKEVLQNLENITFIGLQEKFATSIEKLNQKFGWQLDYQQQRTNASTNNFTKPISNENMERIQKYIEPELAVYRRAEEIFRKY